MNEPRFSDPPARTVAGPGADLSDDLVDQQRRWQQGEKVLVEFYLERHAALRADRDRLLDLIYHEIVLREQRGEAPCLADYLARFPQLADDLRLHFEVHAALHSVASHAAASQPAASQASSSPASGASTKVGQPGILATAASPALVPAVPGFKLMEVLGRGGMGVVYKARDISLGRAVALKFLHPADRRDPEALARFFREARTASALNHPHICTIYELGECGGQPFIVMEWIEGHTLRALIGQRLSARALARLFGQAAQALRVAHAAGIVHRDIKPENIMVRADGYVKVLDFGLARLLRSLDPLDPAAPAGAEPGMLVGTMRYMAPEQARAEEATSAADIFSLGLVLYELVTGRHAFEAATPLGTLKAIVSEPLMAPRQLDPQIPAALDSLIVRMLAKDEALRPTAEQVQAALDEFVHEAAPPTSAASADSAGVASGRSQVNGAPLRSRRRRRWATAALVLSPFVVLGAWSVFHFTGSGEVILIGGDEAAKAALRDARIKVIRRADQQEATLTIGRNNLPVGRYDVPWDELPGNLKVSKSFGVQRGATIVLKALVSAPAPGEANAAAMHKTDAATRAAANTAASAAAANQAKKADSQPVGPPPPLSAPFSAAQAQESQQRWASFLQEKVVQRHHSATDMVLIPPGSFTMGLTEDNIGHLQPMLRQGDAKIKDLPEFPPRRVTITRPFRLSVKEVPLRTFQEFIDQTKYKTVAEESPGLGSGFIKEASWARRPEFNFRNIGVRQRVNEPVVNIGFEDAVAFCEWFSKQEGMIYRLPTEAEWEYACRAGSEALWHYGDKWHDGDDYAWVSANSGYRPNLIGLKLPNAFGLRDMHGNVAEICSDWFATDYYARGPAQDPPGPDTGKERVARGGSFFQSFLYTRSSYRLAFSGPAITVGFRIACEIDVKE